MSCSWGAWAMTQLAGQYQLVKSRARTTWLFAAF